MKKNLCACLCLIGFSWLSSGGMAAQTTLSQQVITKRDASQSTDKQPNATSALLPKVLLGGGLSAGLIFADEVNQYLREWADERGGQEDPDENNTDLFFTLAPQLSVAYIPVPFVQLSFFLEFGWAPSFIFTNDDSVKMFHFVRLSPGVQTLFLVPFRYNVYSLFIGPGIEFDEVKFESYRAETWGFRGTLGVRITERDVTTDIFASILVTGADSQPVHSDRLMLSYSSFLVGVNVYFHSN